MLASWSGTVLAGSHGRVCCSQSRPNGRKLWMCVYSKCKDEKEEAERRKRANGVQLVEGEGRGGP